MAVGTRKKTRDGQEELGTVVGRMFFARIYAGGVREPDDGDEGGDAEGEGDEIEAEGGENGAEAGEAVLVGNLELEHHDGDDDGDDSVGEGFEASWGGSVVGHEFCCRGVFRLWQKHTTAIVRARACS